MGSGLRETSFEAQDLFAAAGGDRHRLFVLHTYMPCLPSTQIFLVDARVPEAVDSSPLQFGDPDGYTCQDRRMLKSWHADCESYMMDCVPLAV
jgi:hypothetical protein